MFHATTNVGSPAAFELEYLTHMWHFNTRRTPAVAIMHGPHSLLSVRTNRVNQPYSHTAEVLTKGTDVIRGLPIDRDQQKTEENRAS